MMNLCRNCAKINIFSFQEINQLVSDLIEDLLEERDKIENEKVPGYRIPIIMAALSHKYNLFPDAFEVRASVESEGYEVIMPVDK